MCASIIKIVTRVILNELNGPRFDS